MGTRAAEQSKLLKKKIEIFTKRLEANNRREEFLAIRRKTLNQTRSVIVSEDCDFLSFVACIFADAFARSEEQALGEEELEKVLKYHTEDKVWIMHDTGKIITT